MTQTKDGKERIYIDNELIYKYNYKRRYKRMGEEKKKTNTKRFAILLIITFIVIIAASYVLISEVIEKNKEEANVNLGKSEKTTIEKEIEKTEVEVPDLATENEYVLTDNNLSKFDLSFLK